MPEQHYILALDQGTTSSRAFLFDLQGKIHGQAKQEHLLSHPHGHYVEQDPLEIWHGQLSCAKLAIDRSGISPKQIHCLGITNQRESILLWERKTGTPLSPIVSWQDRRTTEHCQKILQDAQAPAIQQKTGLLIDPYFSATKIRWLLDHYPEARTLAQSGQLCIGTIDSWLLWHLTEGKNHKTDITNASRTMLFNIHQQAWDEDLLRYFGIPRHCLPTVQASASLFGHTASHLLGISIPISGIAGDQQSSLLGHGCHQSGQAKNTYGTGCFLLLCVEQHVRSTDTESSLILTPTCQPGHYALEGSVFMGGNVFQWLKDQLHFVSSPEEIEPLARSVPDTNSLFFVPAFHGLGAPYWDSEATGLFIGIKRTTTPAHFVRAAIEAIALRCAEVFDIMAMQSGTTISSLYVDGKAAQNQLLMQLQADFLGVEVIVPDHIEITVLGAARLAALGAHLITHIEDIPHASEKKNVYSPMMQHTLVREKKAQWRMAVERARDWPPRCINTTPT